jgi:Rieske Fe-S protein
MSNYYPSGTDLSYFDDPSVEETEPNGDETVECLHHDCRKEFDVTPDGAQMVGGDEGVYQWWAFDAECPHCGDTGNYGDCD